LTCTTCVALIVTDLCWHIIPSLIPRLSEVEVSNIGFAAKTQLFSS
jgi:hypothetical protein